jgi:hypothetical protein
MNFRSGKQAVVAIMVVGLMLLALKLICQEFGQTEWALLCVSLVYFGLVLLRFRQRRERRQLESMRDSALW